MLLGPKDLPFAVSGERCLIAEKPPKERTVGGLYLPETAKERYYSGRLLDAGLQAMDKLYDNGFEIGDEVEYGRYAGLREAWDHVIEGDHTLPEDCYDWKRDTEHSSSVCERYICSKTKAVRIVESVIVINVDDIIASRELAERLRAGKMKRERAKSPDGESVTGLRTQHIIERSTEDSNGTA